jgi:hypothetical protein
MGKFFAHLTSKHIDYPTFFSLLFLFALIQVNFKKKEPFKATVKKKENSQIAYFKGTADVRISSFLNF